MASTGPTPAEAVRLAIGCACPCPAHPAVASAHAAIAKLAPQAFGDYRVIRMDLPGDSTDFCVERIR